MSARDIAALLFYALIVWLMLRYACHGNRGVKP